MPNDEHGESSFPLFMAPLAVMKLLVKWDFNSRIPAFLPFFAASSVAGFYSEFLSFL